jgi:hypothetical protein
MKKRLLIATLLIILVGCGTRLIYFHLDWLIPWYIGDYVSLDSEQKSMLEKRLAAQLEWHCRTQLPVYAETLRALAVDIGDADHPIEKQRLRYHYMKFMGLWKVLLNEIAPDITDIMLTASDAQIDELFSNLDKRNQKFREKYVDPPPEELTKNRQKRMIKNLERWMSDLTSEQKQAVANWSSRVTPISQVWLQNREATQAYARRLLENRNDSPEFRKKLVELIVNPELMYTPEYRQKLDFNTEVTLDLIIELDRTLSSEQRQRGLKRIESLAADFDKLSCDPQTLPKKSSGVKE